MVVDDVQINWFYMTTFILLLLFILEYSKLSATALRHVNKTAQLEIEITQLVNETNKLKNRSKNPGKK